MALKTNRGQVINVNEVQIPVIDWKTLGLTEKGRAFKNYFKNNFIILGKYAMLENGGKTFQIGNFTTDESRIQIFHYGWTTIDDEKPVKKGEIALKWHNIYWTDSNLRLADGDMYNDPGIALGLDIPQEEQKMQPGLHGAPSGQYPIFDTYKSTVRVPVIWDVAYTEDSEVDGKTGKLVWLELSFYQYKMLMETIAEYDAQIAKMLKKNNLKQAEDRIFVIEYVKDPKAKNSDRNSVTVVETVDSTTDFTIINDKKQPEVVKLSTWYTPFLDTAVKEYEKMLNYVEKRFTFFKSITDRFVAGEIDEATASQLVHAAIVEKLMVGWAEIDEDHGLSPESLSQLFETLVPQYSVNATATAIPASAIKSSVTVDLGSGEPF